jgi:hypothetical protein
MFGTALDVGNHWARQWMPAPPDAPKFTIL